MSKGRIVWVDILKYICIIFVMLSHLESHTELLKAFYQPWFLTAFFFVSGYTYEHKSNFGAFFRKKVKQLFVPWFVFSTFNILLSSVISLRSNTNLFAELGWNYLQIRGKGDGIWFVAALFIAFIPFYFLIKWIKEPADFFHCTNDKSKRMRLAILLAFTLSFISVIYTKYMSPSVFSWNSVALPWHLEYIFQAMFYMVLGYSFKMEYEVIFDKYNNTRNRLMGVFLYLLAVFLPYALRFEYSDAEMLGIIYQYAIEILGIFVLISICKELKTNRYVSYIGQNTLICFALHGKCYSVIEAALRHFASGFYNAILNNILISSVFSIGFSIVLSFILIIPIIIINKWFPFLLGRKRQNTA